MNRELLTDPDLARRLLPAPPRRRWLDLVGPCVMLAALALVTVYVALLWR